MSKLIDLTNLHFDRLVVVSRVARNRINRSAVWLCRCDCGRECEVYADSLRLGKTRSCGCLLEESSRKKFGRKSQPTTADVQANHAMRQAFDDDLMARITERC